MAFDRRRKIPVVRLAGTRLEVLHQLGRRFGAGIAARVGTYSKRVRDELGRDQSSRLEKGCLGAAVDQTPEYVEELRAMAEGAGVPFADLFRFNITEIFRLGDKCTTVVLPTSPAGRREVLFAHNEDWDPANNDVIALSIRFSDEDVSFAALGYEGFLPGLSCGFNSHGLCHAVNYLYPRDLRIGLPRIFVTRKLVTARSIAECRTWIGRTRRAFGQSIGLAEGARYCHLELTARRVAEIRPRLPYAHTNHYVATRLRNVAAPASRSSRERLSVARRLLRGDARRGESLAKRILSDRSRHPYSIWREADAPEDAAATLASAIFTTGSDRMRIYRRRPVEASPLVVELPPD